MENKLKHDILAVVSMGVMAKRRALDMLPPRGKYVAKSVAEMYADKLIRRAPHRIVRLGPEARSELSEDEWNLYLALSNNDAPGCDKLHVDAYVRASDFLCMAYAAGIITQFYRVPMIRTKSPELTDGSDQSVAVLRRDLKIEGQKQQRMNGTRASGYIYSPGFCGTVTATNGRNLRVSRSGERQEALICSAERARVSDIQTPIHQYEALLIAPSDDSLLHMLQQRNMQNTLAAAVYDRHCTGQEYRYVPATIDGVRGLRFITQNSPEDILHQQFMPEHIQAAAMYRCDALIGSLQVVEFLTCNLTKLLRFAGDPKIGVVCWDWQIDFVGKLWGRKLEYARIIPCSGAS